MGARRRPLSVPERPRSFTTAYQVYLDGPNEAPELTYFQAIERFWGYMVPNWRKLRHEDYMTIYHEFLIMPFDLYKPADLSFYIDAWYRMDSPWSRAYGLLQSLNIGPDLTGADGAVGGLEFFDGPFPGSDYLGVHCDDDISISLLQTRLLELGENIEVQVATLMEGS